MHVASRRFVSRLALASFTASALAVAIAACSADGAPDVATSSEAGAEPEENGAVLPPPSNTDGGAIVDARADAKGADAGKDAGKDGGADAGQAAPTPGTTCAVADEIFVRTCGVCGKQTALCLANADGGPGGVVTEYNACSDEVDGGCLPGTTDNEACGNCGTRVRTCNKYCAWTAGPCTGEPVDSCSPTANDYTTAGCPAKGTVRQRECGNACKWSPLSSCQPLSFTLTAAANVGETASEIYPLRAPIADKRVGGTCGSNYFSTTADYPYVYVEVSNPTALTMTLSAWNTHASNGGPSIATVMTVYATKPADEAARKGCAKTVAPSCPTGLPCGYASFAGLTGTNAFTIPPSGSVLVFFQSYYATGATQPSAGDVKLVVRTDALQ